MSAEARDKESERVENAGTQSGDRHNLLVEHLPLGIFALDSEGNILEANPALLSILGIASVKAARDINVLSFPTLVQSGIAQYVQQCLESGDMLVADRPFVSEQDRSAYLRLHLLPVTGCQSGSIAVQGIIEDIRDHVLTEELLRE